MVQYLRMYVNVTFTNEFVVCQQEKIINDFKIDELYKKAKERDQLKRKEKTIQEKKKD